ncbi:MAG: acyl-[acyl-carrier-protein] thioesterase [Dysgonamonadaceae bacterium]|jgi:acyl-ACP thioesterase|nr:acyl-[acyl-carrier-protein] thioesterase [Dysgonamonadaceae bacterium]
MPPALDAVKFHVESYVCDFTGRATLPVMSGFILDAASVHAHRRGFGLDKILNDGITWVLSRLSLEIYQYPVSSNDITVETWIEDVGRFFTQRCFRFVRNDGRTLGYARSIWAAINIDSRSPVNIPEWRPDLKDYILRDNKCPIAKMEKIPPVNSTEPVMSYSVRYSDIDINRHMNSMKYIEHVVNVFDLQTFKEKIIGKFEIVYLQEGRFSDRMKLYRENLPDGENIIDTKRDGESVCRSRIIWKPLNHPER